MVESPPQSRNKIAIAAVVALFVVGVGWRVCSRADGPRDGDGATRGTSSVTPNLDEPPSTGTARANLSAPIAAAYAGAGDVIVAGLDVGAKAIRVMRINAQGEVVVERTALADVAWTTDADLKVAASPTGAAVTWRGMRGGKLVRQLVSLGADLVAKGEPKDVTAASCATRDGLWFSDGTSAISRPWSGPSVTIPLPKDKDASLLCASHRAFAVLEEEDRTSVMTLNASPGDARANETSPVTMVRENDFGEDEQRELNVYAVGEDMGVVRLARSGTLALREITAGSVGATRRLKTTIPQEDDVVVVDASPGVVVIVYTQDAASTCPASGVALEAVVSTRIMALRVDRQSFEESTVEVSPGRCGHEVGPFFTGALGDNVSVAWVERTGGAGQARAPIVGLAHAIVGKGGAAVVTRTAQSADALVDAGCDGSTCYAVALARREGMDAMVPGFAKVLRYK